MFFLRLPADTISSASSMASFSSFLSGPNEWRLTRPVATTSSTFIAKLKLLVVVKCCGT
ncbi:MAG: hypothetical protein WC924_00570 [Candidatus Gracilibacteria bacterium]